MIEIDKREIWKAKDELTKRKTYSARMQYGFQKGIEFALEQVNKNDLLANCDLLEMANTLLKYEYTQTLKQDWILTIKNSMRILHRAKSKEELLRYVISHYCY